LLDQVKKISFEYVYQKRSAAMLLFFYVRNILLFIRQNALIDPDHLIQNENNGKLAFYYLVI